MNVPFAADRPSPPVGEGQTCWVLTEGLTGTQNPCIALARACGFAEPVLKITKLRAPWRWVTPYVRFFSPAALAAGSSQLTAPWPDLLIASGRKAIAAALWIKRQNNGRTTLVILQSPVVTDRHFDLVIAPRHDAYDAPNSLPITGTLSLVTAGTLAAAHAEFPHLNDLPSPKLAVLIGGNSRTHAMTDAVADRLIRQLQALQAKGYGLMITASRRTPDHVTRRMRDALRHGGTQFWDGTGLNPYQAYLAHCDAVLVTEDSVSMACEAVSTGKPVYIIKMAGGSDRFKRFHDYLTASHYARWFDGNVENWPYTPPDDLAMAAGHVKMLLQK